MRVLVAGEGPTELGRWFHPLPYRDETNVGLLEALLCKATSEACVVADGVAWKRIRKYRAGQHRQAEERNVLGLCLLATECGASGVVFSRDRDGDAQREKDVYAGVQTAKDRFPGVQVAGAVAVEAVEAWLLALVGEHNAEDHTDPKPAWDGRSTPWRDFIRDTLPSVDIGGAASRSPSLKRFLESCSTLR